MTMRVAILGCGRIAQLVHLRQFAANARCNVVAVADREPANLAAARRIVPGATGFADWPDAVSHPGVDAVIICLPPALHAAAAVAAFAAGRHVYVEKPLALDPVEGQAMLDAQRRADRIGMIGFNFRFNPAFIALKGRVARGEIGEVIAVRSLFTSARRVLPDWKTTRAAGGGALRELGAHHADLVADLIGSPPVTVTAEERTVVNEADLASACIGYASGVLLTMTVGLATGHNSNRIELLGSRGHLVAEAADARPRAVQRPPGRLARVHGLVDRLGPLHPAELLKVPGREPSFAAAFDTFVRACRGEPVQYPSLDDGQRALELVTAAEQAAATGRRVSLAPA